ncbi:hypothetical protein GCM10009827_106880 [Dactylosporangium maewongense]|uniref:histidine kinase n=1 Tax=Dactylosporangium maewongense TaxID=634393 RepID=A0ABN2D2Y8_9ACTN
MKVHRWGFGHRPSWSGLLGAGLTRQVVGLCTVFAVALSAILAVMLTAVAKLDQEVRSARSSQAALISAGQLQSSVLAVASAERGYIITHDPRFMQSWEQARTAIPQQTTQLAGSVLGDPRQQARVQLLNQEITAYMSEESAPVVVGVHPGGPASDPVHLVDSQQRLDEIHTGFAQFHAIELRAAARQAAGADVATVWARAVAGAGLAGSVLVMLMFATLVNRGIVRPVRAAAGMADQLAGGALSTRMPEDGPHEIGSLQRSFNTMATSLESHRDDLNRFVAEQRALRRIATLVARASPPQTVFSAVTDEVRELLGADLTMLLRYELDGAATVVAACSPHDIPVAVGTRTILPPHGAAVHVYTEQRPCWTRVGEGTCVADPFLSQYGIKVSVGAPIVVQGNLWGVLIVMASSDEQLSPDDAPRTAAFTDLAGLAVANLQARADLAAASVRIVEASDQARRKVERDLHDGTQQRLLALLLGLRQLQARTTAEPPGLADELATINADLAGTLDELRELSHGIHPAILTERGLESALKTLTRRSPVPAELHIHLPSRLPPNIETGAYYIIAEAFTNTAKHASASYVCVTVTADAHTLRLRIEDDGVGGADPSAGSGIRGLDDRVTALGGSSRLTSPPGQGTTLRFTIPLELTTVDNPTQTRRPPPGTAPGANGE